MAQCVLLREAADSEITFVAVAACRTLKHSSRRLSWPVLCNVRESARPSCPLVAQSGFVGVGGKVVGANMRGRSPLAMRVHVRVFAQFHKMLLERDFVGRSQSLPVGQRSECFKPRGHAPGRFPQGAFRVSGFCRVTSMCPRDAPYVRPIQAPIIIGACAVRPARQWR